LATGSNLKLLITSRAALHVYGEHDFSGTGRWSCAGFAVTEERWKRCRSALAIELFLERAKAAQAGF